MTKHLKEYSDLMEMDPKDWAFEPAELPESAYDMFDEALDLAFNGFGVLSPDPNDVSLAEVSLRLLVKDHPNFIDGHHHLALLLEQSGREMEALFHRERAVNIGMQSFIEAFSSSGNSLRWGWMGNRQFLRSYCSLGLQCMKDGNLSRAVAIFETMLKVNPNDNQGARSILIECYLEMNRPADVLKICMKYPNDCSEDILYGKVLALLIMGKKKRAEAALAEAVRHLPKVAKELVKKSHRRPAQMWAGSITVGGDDQAFCYWERQGKLWKKTEGAIEFVREFVTGKPAKGAKGGSDV